MTCPRGLLVAALALTLFLGPSGCEGKKKVKTTHKELKCSSCVAVAREFTLAIMHEWDVHAGQTILIEKRKKKVKVPYRESELSIQEALDHMCEESKYKNFNVSVVNGKPRYVKQKVDTGSKEFKKKLAGMCQEIMEHDHDVITHFLKNKDTMGRAPEGLCTEVMPFCTTEQYKEVTTPKDEEMPAADAAEGEAEGGAEGGAGEGGEGEGEKKEL